MIDTLRLLIAVELVGLAALPIAFQFFGGLPDRGYAFAKTLGLLLISYITWIVGNVIPVGGPIFPVLVLVIIGTATWITWHRRTIERFRDLRMLILIEEALFVGGLIAWTLARAYLLHPDIRHTEQFMDMAFLNASSRSTSYPVYDPWMSGHGINYYYFGYLIFGLLLRVAGIAPSVGYNLTLSLIAAFTLVGAFSLGLALTRRVPWALLAPLFVALLGNWYAALTQLPHGQYPSNTYLWFWQSSRVVSSAADYTINEFPLFSFVLGDLHPHVMALPFTLLTCGVAFAVLLSTTPRIVARSRTGWAGLTLASLVLGSLFTINSWDFPTFGLLVGGALFVRAYLEDDSPTWWQSPAINGAALLGLSLFLYAPFYLHFRSLAHGVGFVHTHSDLVQYLEVFAFPLLTCGSLVAALTVLLRPVDAGPEEVVDRERVLPPWQLAERGTWQLASMATIGAAIVLLGVAILLHLGALLLPMALAFGALTVLHRVLNSEAPNRSDALALLLVAVGCLVLVLTETIYIKDSFDLSASYRMNTVFKFYYQAWQLLMVAGAYGVFRTWLVARQLGAITVGRLAMIVLTIGAVGPLLDTFYGPQATFAATTITSLDGSAWLRAEHPSDYAAIEWLIRHAPANSVVLEASSSQAAYNTDFARVSVFTGLRTVMGWPDHEEQWRPNDPEIPVRTADVTTAFSTSSIPAAKQILRHYHVQYVFVGDTEHRLYGSKPNALRKFATFMHPAFSNGGTTVYTW